MACLAEGLIRKDKYLGVLIACFVLKIILKERQERKQQRLQENTGSPAPASDPALDGESGGDDRAPEQAVPSGIAVPAAVHRASSGRQLSGAGWPDGVLWAGSALGPCASWGAG